jgi:adenylate cyclase class IV
MTDEIATPETKSEEIKIARFTEFETKYSSDISQLSQFKSIAGNLPGLLDFTYCEGPDTYMTKPDGSFGRYRAAKYPHDTKYAQWTLKCKAIGAKNNFSRLEYNWRVDGTPAQEILDGAIAMGFTFNFKISKECFIYRFPECTLVFYSVKEEGSTKWDYYIEIEITEETVHELTEEQAWDIIRKYEKILEPVGVTAQKRKRLSLYEMYRKGF